MSLTTLCFPPVTSSVPVSSIAANNTIVGNGQYDITLPGERNTVVMSDAPPPNTVVKTSGRNNDCVSVGRYNVLQNQTRFTAVGGQIEPNANGKTDSVVVGKFGNYTAINQNSYTGDLGSNTVLINAVGNVKTFTPVLKDITGVDNMVLVESQSKVFSFPLVEITSDDERTKTSAFTEIPVDSLYFNKTVNALRMKVA